MDDAAALKLLIQKMDDHGTRLSGIENAIISIAVQEERSLHLSAQVTALWNKYDAAFGPEGSVSHIKSYQDRCPKDSLEKSLARQWKVISVILILVTAVCLKAFKLV